MNIWDLLKRPVSKSETPQKGIWQRLVSTTDLSAYIPQKIDLIEEKRIESRRSGDYFVVKNEDKIRYLKLTPEDYFLWQKIDGNTSFSDLVMSYFQKFGSFAFNRIHSLINQLRHNYFLEEKPVRLFSRLKVSSQSGNFSSKMMLLVRAFMQKEVPFSHLDQWLTRMYNGFFWLFFTQIAKWSYLILSLFGVACFASFLHSGQYNIVQVEGSYLFGLLILVSLQVFIILLHEGAHAFATKSYGREVPRGGFMLYMGMPAFFVDTTDMWLENKKKRIAVSWAGPYSELVVGGLFALYMVLFPDSPANPILFKCLFLFYLGVFLNMNPLLELDGYYILVDLLEIPMLRRRSFEFVRKDLFRKLKAREAFSLGEKIFTVFGSLAGAYTLFALTVAFYFWQTRIFDSMVELWNKGIGSQIAVCLLVLASLGPIVLFLVIKCVKLVRWSWEQILSNPVFKSVNKGTPVVLLVLALALAVGWNQTWVPFSWVRIGFGIFLVLTVAHFIYWHQEKIFPKSPWTLGLVLFSLATLLLALSELRHLNPDPVFHLIQQLSFFIYGAVFLISLTWSKNFFWPASLLLAALLCFFGSPYLNEAATVALFSGEVLILATILSFILSIRTLLQYKADLSLNKGQSDDEKLETTFIGLVDFLKRDLNLYYMKLRAGALGKKLDRHLEGLEGGDRFKEGLSILEKSKAASRVFQPFWNEYQQKIGSFWAQFLIGRFFDHLDWQEREILDHYLFKGKDWEKSVLEKQGESRRSLENILKNNFLFGDLSEEEIVELSKLFKQESFHSKSKIIKQGEAGDRFYLIKSGVVAVRIQNSQGVEKEVATLYEGDFFGEIALLKEVPRTATCLALNDVVVWSLDKESFSHYVKERFSVSISVERAIAIMRLISAMPLFKELSPTQMRQLASSFISRKMKPGEPVIQQGEPGKEFFVIEKGECVVKIKGEQGKEQEVATLSKGECFGEMALLSNAPRSATIQAVTEVELLVLSKENFDEMIKSSLSSGNIEKVSSRRRLDSKKKTKQSIAEV